MVGDILIFDYSGSDYSRNTSDDLIECKFNVGFDDLDNVGKIMEATEKWASQSVGFNRNVKHKVIKVVYEDGRLGLVIRGRGHDGRCRLCRSFRTRLKNNLSRHGIVMKEKGLCRFDEREGRGTSDEQKLKDRIKLYELGMSEETGEDIERLKKSLERVGG